jgi:hypothetical protein
MYRYGTPGTQAACLREAAHQHLLAHESSGELPTSNRFILYELRQAHHPALHGSKSRGRGKGARSEDQNLSDAVMWLRERAIVPWDWLADETRSLTSYRGTRPLSRSTSRGPWTSPVSTSGAAKRRR